MGSWTDVLRYRATAARLRRMAQRMQFPESRIEALRTAEQFERLADHAERRLGVRVGRAATILSSLRRAS